MIKLSQLGVCASARCDSTAKKKKKGKLELFQLSENKFHDLAPFITERMHDSDDSRLDEYKPIRSFVIDFI